MSLTELSEMVGELPVEERKKLLDKVSNDLVIKRVPRPTLIWFKDYANDEFSGDYGMCLVFIIKTFRGFIPPDQSMMVEELEDLRREVEQLKNKGEEEVPTVKMADGTIRRKRQ